MGVVTVMELEEPSFDFPRAPDDRRPAIPPPPPVRLVAVEDVTLFAAAADQAALNAFYMDLLRFERDLKAPGLVYKAENARLIFEMTDAGQRRDDLRAIGIELPSLADVELALIDRQIPFARERLLTLGRQTFLLRDPAGNWVRLGEIKRLL